MQGSNVEFATKSLIQFLTYAEKSGSLPTELVHQVKDRSKDLLESLQEPFSDPEALAGGLNALIDEMNTTLETKGAPYPLIATKSSLFQLKGEIVAFEYALHQALVSGRIRIDQEKPLFDAAMIVWRDAGSTVPLKQAALQFSSLIQKFNAFLPEGEKYPLPDENAYS